jgi:prepilin-type processing-associated H-X9-DG protein
MDSADPLDRERTDEKPKSAYLSKKDLRVFGVVLVFLFLLLYPVFIVMRQNTWRYLCGRNFESMSKAVLLYSEGHEGRFPPVAGDYGAPIIQDGKLYCWATIADLRQNMDPERSFLCPAATEDEAYHIAGPNRTTEAATYGMYLPLGAANISSLTNPQGTVLFAETSNMGSRDTADPVKYTDASGAVIPNDGYAIGWDTSNTFPAPSTHHATRLAFYETANGQFKEEGPARHGDGIYFLFADGHRKYVKYPSQARILMDSSSGRPKGMWEIPYSYTDPGR